MKNLSKWRLLKLLFTIVYFIYIIDAMKIFNTRGERKVKINCGTDIIEIDRIKDSIENIGQSFLNRVYTENEIKYCESKKAQKYQHYAARFAAKEAVFKAISVLLEDKYSICWKDIEVINDKQGKPEVNLIGVNLKNIEQIDLSMSHCRQYATANVVVILK